MTPTLRMYIAHIRTLLTAHGTLYVHWGRGDRTRAVSHNAITGGCEAGLSASELHATHTDDELCEQLAEYGYLRLRNARIRPAIIAGDRIGRGGDGEPVLGHVRVVEIVPRHIVGSLDAWVSNRMRAQYPQDYR